MGGISFDGGRWCVSATTASPTSGPGGSVGAGKSVLARLSEQDTGPYRGRFQLVDDETRQPISSHPYTVTSADGRTIQSMTDSNGYTDWLSSHQASSLTFQHDPATDA